MFLIDPKSALLENQVAIGLRQRFGDEVYYFLKQIEVVFFVPAERLAGLEMVVNNDIVVYR